MLFNLKYIKKYLTNNNDKPVTYRWTHGATDEHLGDGLLIYSIILSALTLRDLNIN